MVTPKTQISTHSGGLPMVSSCPFNGLTTNLLLSQNHLKWKHTTKVNFHRRRYHAHYYGSWFAIQVWSSASLFDASICKFNLEIDHLILMFSINCRLKLGFKFFSCEWNSCMYLSINVLVWSLKLFIIFLLCFGELVGYRKMKFKWHRLVRPLN